MASGEDFKASNLSEHRSNKGVNCEGTAVVIRRRHQAAANLAAELEWTRTETTDSNTPRKEIDLELFNF